MGIFRPSFVLALCLASMPFFAGCSTAELSAAGAQVVASPNAPDAACKEVKHLVGHGGGAFGGDLIANDDLIDYALNDLRNQGGEAGANYVQYDPPQLGSSDGTTTTATISGVAFRCP